MADNTTGSDDLFSKNSLEQEIIDGILETMNTPNTSMLPVPGAAAYFGRFYPF